VKAAILRCDGPGATRSSLGSKPSSPRSLRKSSSLLRLSRGPGIARDECDRPVPVLPQVGEGLAEARRAVGDDGREAVARPDEDDREAGTLEIERVAAALGRAQGETKRSPSVFQGPTGTKSPWSPRTGQPGGLRSGARSGRRRRTRAARGSRGRSRLRRRPGGRPPGTSGVVRSYTCQPATTPIAGRLVRSR